MIEMAAGPVGHWDKEGFEDLITRGLTLAYESKFAPGGRALMRGSGVDKKDIQAIKHLGPYFPPNKFYRESSIYKLPPEVPLAATGIFALRSFGSHEDDLGRTNYVTIALIQRVESLPAHYHRMGGGVPYKIVIMQGLNETAGYQVYKVYGTVDKNRMVHGTYKSMGSIDDKKWNITEDDHIQEAMGAQFNLAATLCVTADRGKLWNVQASETSEAHATFGVLEEQIQSLFYARSLPLLASGRKRPILHWVECHRRRLKNGITINVAEHLRGIDTFDMHGTRFKITLPRK